MVMKKDVTAQMRTLIIIYGKLDFWELEVLQNNWLLSTEKKCHSRRTTPVGKTMEEAEIRLGPTILTTYL